MTDEQPGMKFDGQGDDGREKKPRWELLPWELIEEVVKVLTAGSIKYDDENWKSVKPRSRYIGALIRHFIKWQKGVEYDQDIYKRSGFKVNHLACLICNALFLMWFDKNPEEKTGWSGEWPYKYALTDETAKIFLDAFNKNEVENIKEEENESGC